MTGNLPVFVYGTLRAGESNAAVLDEFVVDRRTATLPGHRLHVLEYPCVVEDARASLPRAAAPVRGELVTLHDGSYRSAIERLDWLEGFLPHDPAGSLYRRTIAEAATVEGAFSCWVYVAGDELRRRLDTTNVIPSGDWSAR